jgi:phospholipid/cholesterol/gamma-HCH transport system substrate-binding protein
MTMTLSNEARIGIVVTAAAVILVGGVLFLRGVDLRSRQYSLNVYYPNVNGLQTGDKVTVAGLAIGHVESMSLVGRRITVNLSLQTKVHLPRDSKALLKSETIMGGKFIEITPGTDQAILQNGDSLSGLYEADLSELTATLSPITSNVLGILQNVNSTFDEPTRNRIKGIIVDLGRSSAQLERVIHAQGTRLESAVEDFALFSRDLSHFARTLDTVAVSQRDNIDESMKSLKLASGHAERVSATLESTTESLNSILAQLNRGEGTLGKLVHDERLYNDIDSLSVSLTSLVRDLKENPGRYVRIGLF